MPGMPVWFWWTYLVGARQPQSVEDRDEDMCWDEQAQEIGAAEEPVLGSKRVDLWWCPQDGHGRLEGRQQGQWHRQAGHRAIGHQELLQRAAECIVKVATKTGSVEETQQITGELKNGTSGLSSGSSQMWRYSLFNQFVY